MLHFAILFQLVSRSRGEQTVIPKSRNSFFNVCFHPEYFSGYFRISQSHLCVPVQMGSMARILSSLNDGEEKKKNLIEMGIKLLL